ncbi:hypothetical protein [Tenacibaculum sp. IB213877]|uniref:hypothetical protein n=1 Tax=Tenacibaculum sp. IB213877 TaxID=3097351 RepID=UPI002A59D0C0|nr:hypothetical protein [Tenacibaculum sp. IB213877]MDY0781065.1 hypothetical protein [Tenacibaculum sp. IB213877]
MQKIILFSLLLFINCSNSEQKDKIKKVKTTVELSIKRVSSKSNKIIWAFNEKKAKGIDNSDELQKLYEEASITNKACRTLLENLENIDSKIDLKKEAIKYVDYSEVLLTKFSKPIIKTNLDTLANDTKLIEEMFRVVKEGMEVTQKMNDKLFAFCKEHKLKSEFTTYDKSEFDEKVEEVERLIIERK